MREHTCQGIINTIFCPVADIRQVSCLEHAKSFLDKSLLHYHHLTEQAHFLVVRDPHIGVRVGGHAAWNDERTRASKVNAMSGWDECVLQVSKY